MLGFSYRRDRIILWSVLAVLGWYFLGGWLTALSDKHAWLSSFVEIAFALDSSLTIERARSFLLKPFSNCCYRRMEKMRVACGKDLDDKTTETLTKKAQDLYSRFSSRMAADMQWIPYFGGCLAFVSLMLLLTDCPEGGEKFVPLCIAPVLCFGVGAVFEFATARREFAFACENVEENVRNLPREDFMRQMESALPVRDGEAES